MNKKIWFLIAVFFIASPIFSANNLFAAGPGGLRTGMKMEDAMLVAARCVREAGGFKDRKDRDQRIMRPQDKLSFLGVTDAKRLDALIRHLVKNEEMGVQSIWNDDSNPLTQRFIISKDDLKDVAIDWTLAKLAALISEKSGLPMLPYATSKQIVSNCIQRSRIRFFEAKQHLPPVVPEWVPISSAIKVRDHIVIAKIRDNFYKCLVEDRAFGVHEVRVESPSDEEVPYQLSEQAKKEIADVVQITGVVQNDKAANWTFEELANFIRREARVTFSLKSTAARFVTAALLNQLLEDKKSALGSGYDRKTVFRTLKFDKNETIKQVWDNNGLSGYLSQAKNKIVCRLILSVNSNPQPDDKNFPEAGVNMCGSLKKLPFREPYLIDLGDVKKVKGSAEKSITGDKDGTQAEKTDSKSKLFEELTVDDPIEEYLKTVRNEIKKTLKDTK